MKGARSFYMVVVLLCLFSQGCDQAEHESATTGNLDAQEDKTTTHQQISSSQNESQTDASGVTIGTLADDVLALRGKGERTKVVGNDQYGLLVEWWYKDSIYTMGRREVDGITAYRVVDIRSP